MTFSPLVVCGQKIAIYLRVSQIRRRINQILRATLPTKLALTCTLDLRVYYTGLVPISAFKMYCYAYWSYQPFTTYMNSRYDMLRGNDHFRQV